MASRGLTVNDQKGRLVGFLEEWRRRVGGQPLRSRLAVFLERAVPLLERAITEQTPPTRSADGLRLLMPLLATALRLSDRHVASVNPWTLAGLRRREVRNAGVLAGLWTPSSMGDLAGSFLGEFLDRVPAPEGSSLPDRAELALGYRVRAEHCPSGDDADRVDIVIETKRHLIGVEVKVDAGEGDRQLERYLLAVARSATSTDRIPVVLLLGPKRPSRPDVLWASWSTVRAAIGATMPRHRRDQAFGHHLLDHFARHVGAF